MLDNLQDKSTSTGLSKRSGSQSMLRAVLKIPSFARTCISFLQRQWRGKISTIKQVSRLWLDNKQLTLLPIDLIVKFLTKYTVYNRQKFKTDTTLNTFLTINISKNPYYILLSGIGLQIQWPNPTEAGFSCMSWSVTFFTSLLCTATTEKCTAWGKFASTPLWL